MIRNSLKVKVGVYLMLILTVAVFLFTFLVVQANRDELLQQAISHSRQLSEVVIKSTRFAMLQNEPSHVDQIIQDVGDQKDIDRVRILSKDGRVIHSSRAEEIGTMVDQDHGYYPFVVSASILSIFDGAISTSLSAMWSASP